MNVYRPVQEQSAPQFFGRETHTPLPAIKHLEGYQTIPRLTQNQKKSDKYLFRKRFHIMDAALVSAFSVAGGSLVGALTTLASTWMTQRHSDRRERLAKTIENRETLYATFISEASRVLIESLDHSLDRIGSLLPLYTLVGRIRLSSSQAVVTSAEKLMREVVERYFRPNLTPVQLRDLILSPQLLEQADPIVAFSSVCRGELLSLAQG